MAYRLRHFWQLQYCRLMHASELTLLLNIGFIVITAAGFAFLGKLVKMPSIVAYIIAGIVLGPGLGIVHLDHSLELIEPAKDQRPWSRSYYSWRSAGVNDGCGGLCYFDLDGI